MLSVNIGTLFAPHKGRKGSSVDNSVYIALSKQVVQFRKLEVHANNMANINTPGYKRNEMMVTDWTSSDSNDRKISLAQDIALFRDTAQGALTRTDNNLDLAIEGPGYFPVDSGSGTKYTRDGHFELDAGGTLVNSNGMPVLTTDGGRIVIPDDAKKIEFLADGYVMVDGQEFGQIGLVKFANEQNMTRESGGLYTTSQPGIPVDPAQTKVAQGYTENSNVQPITELTGLIETERSVNYTTTMIDTAYDLQRRATEVWAKTGTA